MEWLRRRLADATARKKAIDQCIAEGAQWLSIVQAEAEGCDDWEAARLYRAAGDGAGFIVDMVHNEYLRAESPLCLPDDADHSVVREEFLRRAQWSSLMVLARVVFVDDRTWLARSSALRARFPDALESLQDHMVSRAFAAFGDDGQRSEEASRLWRKEVRTADVDQNAEFGEFVESGWFRSLAAWTVGPLVVREPGAEPEAETFAAITLSAGCSFALEIYSSPSDPKRGLRL